MLKDGRLKAKPIVTGRIKLDDIVEKGFKELIEYKDENIKTNRVLCVNEYFTLCVPSIRNMIPAIRGNDTTVPDEAIYI